jgi:tetrahydromethanopterin S-methyltransferase subunit D
VKSNRSRRACRARTRHRWRLARLDSEAQGWGYAFGWLYIGLPIVCILLLGVGTVVTGLGGFLARFTLPELIPPLATFAFVAGIVVAGVIFVRRYPFSGR